LRALREHSCTAILEIPDHPDEVRERLGIHLSHELRTVRFDGPQANTE